MSIPSVYLILLRKTTLGIHVNEIWVQAAILQQGALLGHFGGPLGARGLSGASGSLGEASGPFREANGTLRVASGRKGCKWTLGKSNGPFGSWGTSGLFVKQLLLQQLNRMYKS